MYACVDLVTLGQRDRIYKTINSGETWSFLDTLSSRILYDIMIDPNDSKNIYIGTSNQIYKSTDSGVSWEIKEIKTNENISCNGIKINKNNSDIIFGYGDYSINAKNNICFFKSEDGGENWTINIIKSNLGWGDEGFLYSKNSWAIDTTDYQRMYVATYYHKESLLFRTDDGGYSWKDLDIKSAIPSSDYIRSVVIDKNGNIIICISGYGLYRSIDYGETWSKITSKPNNLYSMKFMKNNPDKILGGSHDTLFISSDYGLTWNFSRNTLHGGPIETIVNTSENNIFIGNYDGIFKTSNEGLSWDKKFSGLTIPKLITTLDFSKSNPNIIYVGGNTGIYKSTDKGNSWTWISLIEGIKLLTVGQNSPNLIYVADYVTGYDFENSKMYENSSIYVSINSGVSWQKIKSFLQFNYTLITKDNSIWIGYFDEDQSLYKVIISNDYGINWNEKIVAPFLINRPSIAIDPKNHDVIYIGGYYEDRDIQKGCIFKSIDGGTYWSTIYSADWGNEVNSLCVDPTNTNTIYFGAGLGIFKNNDSVQTLEKINSSYCNAICVDKNGIIYANSIFANVIVSKDKGNTWNEYKEGLTSRVSRNSLKVDDTNNIIYIDTENQGMLSLHLSETTNIKQNKNIISYNLYQNYPNPFNQGTVITYQVTETQKVKVEVLNILGQLVTILVNEDKQQGEYKVFWNGKDSSGMDVPSGVYFYRLIAGDFEEVRKMVLMR